MFIKHTQNYFYFYIRLKKLFKKKSQSKSFSELIIFQKPFYDETNRT